MVSPIVHNIPLEIAHKFTTSPSANTVRDAKILQESIREVLGPEYETFLQGSYRNDTGIPDLNDVDIVALRKNTHSSVFTNLPSGQSVTWDEIFRDVEAKLDAAAKFRGKWSRGDKCITVLSGFSADVVPAVHLGNPDNDPIAIYSFSKGQERKNFPRHHYRNGVSKQSRTEDQYKATVRMFKRWARAWFEGTKIAPSFYIECLIHSVPEWYFIGDPPNRFHSIAQYVTDNVSPHSVVMSVAGDKDILAPNEWPTDSFEQVQRFLRVSSGFVNLALKATSETDAKRYWLEAFNE